MFASFIESQRRTVVASETQYNSPADQDLRPDHDGVGDYLSLRGRGGRECFAAAKSTTLRAFSNTACGCVCAALPAGMPNGRHRTALRNSWPSPHASRFTNAILRAPTRLAGGGRSGSLEQDTDVRERETYGLAGNPDRGKYWSCGHLLGIARPEVGKRDTTPRSDFRSMSKPVTVARPRWICTSFHESYARILLLNTSDLGKIQFERTLARLRRAAREVAESAMLIERSQRTG